VEKKVSSEPPRVVYWQDEKTFFIDPRFRRYASVIKQRRHIIKGGITARSLEELSKSTTCWAVAALDATSGGVCGPAISIDFCKQIWPGTKACLHHCSTTL
jgi:hypothetical protein